MKRYICIHQQFGHEIFALSIAKSLSLDVVILPLKETREEFETESAKIKDNLSFFYERIHTVDFAQRKEIAANSWDFVDDLCKKQLPNWVYKKFALTRLTPDKERLSQLPQYNGLENHTNILFIPQKLISDGKCGITAQQQSLTPDIFNFLKKTPTQLVLGQHFHKVNDIKAIEQITEDFSLYIPGATENPEVFGIRGVKHEQYYNMYKNIDASVGIAGTHTWIMLTTFPEIPQIILYNKNGTESWEKLEKSLQEAGRTVYTIGFDATTSETELKQEIENKYKLLLPTHHTQQHFISKER